MKFRKVEIKPPWPLFTGRRKASGIGFRFGACRNRIMKIATFNVNGITARLSALLRWLGESRPGIVCLQELKAPQERFPEAAIRDAGYGVVWHGQKSWNGVAILARGTEPVERRRVLPGDPEDLHSRYIGWPRG